MYGCKDTIILTHNKKQIIKIQDYCYNQAKLPIVFTLFIFCLPKAV